MSDTRAAIRYAKAILSVAQDNNTSSNVHDEMNDILNCIISNPDLSNMLKSPIVKLSDKSNVLSKVFENTGKEVKSLFKTLISNKRVDLLDEIATQYGQLYEKANNKEQATVITAAAMTEALEKKIMNKLKTLSTRQVTLKKIIDESILGGFILRVGDQQYDASVSNQLNRIKNKFIAN
jgi:F-type H+-transporting ATPase subunit delta